MEIEFGQPRFDISINPPRKDRVTEGISGIVTEKGKPPRKVFDDGLTNPQTSEISLDDSAASNEQPLAESRKNKA